MTRHAWQAVMIALSIDLLIIAVTGGVSFQADFNGDVYVAGLRILHGVSPYFPHLIQREAGIALAGVSMPPVPSPRYPMPILVALTPLSLLPVRAAGILFMVMLIAAVPLGLRLLGVRDPRCHAVALLCSPVVTGVLVGNISPFLLLAVAVVWRCRGRLTLPLAVVAVIVSKLFLWPLGLWIMIRRSSRSFFAACLAGAALMLAAWATIGFAGLLQYPRLLMNVAAVGEARGSSLVAFLIWAGVSRELARLIAFTCAAGLIVLACRIGRRPDGVPHAFGLTVIAALVSCPVVWGHYLVLLFVPIALLSPRLSPLWFIPMLSALAPGEAPQTYGMRVLPILLGELVVVMRLCEPLLAERRQPVRRDSVAIANAAAPS